MLAHHDVAHATLRIGATFAGYGGLDKAVERVFGGKVAWVSEYDKGPSAILAHNYPDAPNHGDITKIDWATMGHVDILTGGYPCQPFSGAGKRLGTEDKRHLFPYFAKGIETLRPRMVVAENVRGHLSLGFDVVLKEWVRVGYDVQWMLIKASDVGAPHGRARLFIFATDPEQVPALATKGTPVTELVGGVWSSPDEHLFGRDAWTGKWPVAGRLVGGVVYDNSADLGDPRAAIQRYLGGETDVIATSGLLPSPAAALGAGGQTSRSGSRSNELLLAGIAEAAAGGMLPTPRATRGGSGTETMYALGAERSDDNRTQGEVLLPTPVASLANGTTPSVERSRVRAGERGLKLDESVMVMAADAADAAANRVTAVVPDALPDNVVLLPTPTRQDGSNHGGPSQYERHTVPLNAAVALLPTPRASDGPKGGPNQRGSSGDFMLPSAVLHMTDGSSALAEAPQVDTKLLPTPVVNDMGKAYTPEEWDTWTARLKAEHGNGNGHGPSLEIEAARLAERGEGEPDALEQVAPAAFPGGPGYEEWGPYAPAIQRWERVTGRAAPEPTCEIRPGGPQRLNPEFVEWMMGQEAGWITDPAIWEGWKPGAARNAQLKACGNGVVTLQAETAVRLMVATR